MGAVVIGIGAALAVLGLVFGLIGFGSAETTSGAGLMMVGSSVFVGGLLMVALGFILRILIDIANKLEGAVHFEALEDEHPAAAVETTAVAFAAEAIAPPAPAFDEVTPVRVPEDLAPLDETPAPPAWFGRKRSPAPSRAEDPAFEPEPDYAPEPALAPPREPEFEREAEPLPPFRSPLTGAARPEPFHAEPVRSEPVRHEPARQETPRHEPARHEPVAHEPSRVETPRVEAPRSAPVRPEPLRPEPLRPEPRIEPVRADLHRAEPHRAEPHRAEPHRAEPEAPEPSSAEPRRELPGFLRGSAGAAPVPERPAPVPALEEPLPAPAHEAFPAEPAAAPAAFLSDTDLLTEEPTPAEPSVTVLKSGTIGGMSYTLYSDGSIEADLPDGVLRFASLQDLRDHVSGSLARE